MRSASEREVPVTLLRAIAAYGVTLFVWLPADVVRSVSEKAIRRIDPDEELRWHPDAEMPSPLQGSRADEVEYGAATSPPPPEHNYESSHFDELSYRCPRVKAQAHHVGYESDGEIV